MTLHSRRQRSIPFLQRNILQGMGNTQSSAFKAAASGDVSNGHHEVRPNKRRRMDADHQLADQIFQARDVGDLQRNLRVQVNRIFHRASKRISLAPSDDVVNLKARCKVSLSHVTKAGEVLLYCNSQLCDIRSFKDPGGPNRMARICLQRPFYIPEDSMRINRDDNGSFDLADSYRLCVELEAAGPTFWPPININSSADDANPTEAIHWVLAAASSDLFTRRKALLNLKVKKTPQSLGPTEHVIDIDAQWTTAFEAGQIRAVEAGTEPSITVSGMLAAQDSLLTDYGQEPLYESPPGTPVKAPRNGAVNGDVHVDEDLEEELTPNRSLRVRGATKNYNLKVLSDKAQGRDKKRKKRGAANVVEEGTVTYHLPSEKVCLDSFRCVTCGMPHSSLPQLQVHLISQHDQYEFRPQSRAKGAEFEVAHRYESYTFGPEPFALRRPTKAFDLDQFADGNISFLTSRLGTEDQSTPGPQPPRRGSKQPLAKPAQTRSKVLLPDIGQTLYDPITRATLQPGTEYKKPPASDKWLIQWHRDALADFSDVPPDEREYMQEWDKFMLTKRLSSSIYFPAAWLSFVRLKSEWLLSSPSRMTEFGKHFTYLLARSSLDHGTVVEALDHIAMRKAKLGIKTGEYPTLVPKGSPQGPHIRKSAGGCLVCGLTVLGPRLLLCTNLKCSKRLYHSDCISENAKMSVDDPDWVCNECFDTQAAERT
ncbi:hypothetical protein CNYM01_03941 [Colletotrichum nymphaeae SA-01]|uniref:Zinc finger PHD-type domain-containing protein n=2 Tax=Colletotrichum acutatum species complex TaxID=2707335 RepID=A0A135T2I8_9PEZI|nr:hypothetical protein CNYM01_03941 [Colletotrichum nymphaeae SA-01]